MKRPKQTLLSKIILNSLMMAGLINAAIGLVANTASALEYTSSPVPVSFTYSDVLTVSTGGDVLIPNLVPGNSTISANNYVITVSTNSVAGYTLSASVGCASGDGCFNSKTLGDGNNNNFAMVESTTALTPGRWGVSFDGTATTSSVFQTLPLYSDTAETINQTTNASGTAAIGYHGTQDTTFRIGAYADENQVAGTYTNSVNFYAVANIVITPLGECSSTESCMQTFTADMCEAQASDAPVTLTDARDGNTYTVRYLQGACWMTQNLRLTNTVSSQYSNFSTNSTFNPCVGDLTAGGSYDEARCHDSGSTETGVWYNYVSASAGTITGRSNSTIATEDICPAGWHLPNYDTTKPAGSVNSLLDLQDKDYFSPVTGGYYYGSSIDIPGSGYWWSSVAYGNMERYHLYYNGSSLGTVSSLRSLGLYIRCVRL